MYGAQTMQKFREVSVKFENDVEMYGAQTMLMQELRVGLFENDVEMYGAQTNQNLTYCA